MVASKNQFTTSNIYAYSEPLDDVFKLMMPNNVLLKLLLMQKKM